MATYKSFSKFQKSKLEKLGYAERNTTEGPKMFFGDGFADIVLTYDGYGFYYEYYDGDGYEIGLPFDDFDDLLTKLKG